MNLFTFNRDTNIGPRLTAAFLAVAFLALASGLIGLVGFKQASEVTSILIQDAEMIESVQEIRLSVSGLSEPPGDFLLTNDPTARQKFRSALNSIQNRISEYETIHQQHSHSVQHTLSANDLIKATSSDLVKMTQLESAIFDGIDPDDRLANLLELKILETSSINRLNQILQNAEEDIESAQSKHETVERNAFIGLGVSAILAVGMALGFAYSFSRSISEPMTQLVKAADQIAGGALSEPVQVKASGEINRLANAFERMRLSLVQERGQARLLAVLEERDRIGREMHDGLAQVLGYVNTKAQAVREFLKSGESHVAERQIDELVTAAQEAYTDAREVIVGLLMNRVGQRDFRELLGEYIEQFTRRNEIAADLTVSPAWISQVITPTVQVQLLRIVQEALTNVRKHANADHVKVGLDIEDGQAVIRVEDNGRGFNLSRLLRPDYSRYGLRTMRERAQAIGGRFRIESAIEKGTCIIVWVPLVRLDGIKSS